MAATLGNPVDNERMGAEPQLDEEVTLEHSFAVVWVLWVLVVGLGRYWGSSVPSGTTRLGSSRVSSAHPPL